MKITEYDVNARGKRLDLVFLSDLHECDPDPIYGQIKRRGADALLFVGDYIQDGEKYERGLEFIKKCASEYPVFCSLGNHEMKYNGDIRNVTRKTGATLLDNGYTEFKGIYIGGLSTGFAGADQGTFKKTPAPCEEFLKEFSQLPSFKLLMSHHPEYYPGYIKKYPVDLTLSGHAHGGQWRLFGKGLFAPGQGIFPKYTSGIYDGRLIVSSGLGDSHKLPRINNPHELVILHLK